MTERLLPPTFALLERDRRIAVDAAILEALPHLDPPSQCEALDLLTTRSHAPTLARLVAGFPNHPVDLQSLIRSRASSLSAGVRAALASSSIDTRVAAIDLVVASGAGELAYLLADALRLSCSATRERAARGLCALVDRAITSNGDAVTRTTQLSHLADAVSVAVGRWDGHAQPQILTAALWLSEYTEQAIRRRIAEPKTKITRALGRHFEATSDTRMAAAALRCLAIDELRPTVATAIASASDARFITAILRESWLLTDPDIARGCRWIRPGPWVETACQVAAEAGESVADNAVRFLCAIGGTPEQKIDRLRKLLETGIPSIRRAAIWHLIADRSAASKGVLTMLAGRSDDAVSKTAGRELRRRGRTTDDGRSKPPKVAAPEQNAPSPVLAELWATYTHGDETVRLRAAENARTNAGAAVDIWLQACLGAADPLDRLRAMHIAEALNRPNALADPIRRLVHDKDAVVRAQAIALLPRLPGGGAERLLRTAINDPDERVQANAVEALERMDVADRASCTKAKLTSPHNRVRANAVKSLLGVELREAGETLLDMLDDASASHRLSALWVVERLRLRAMLHRLEALSERDPNRRVRHRAARILATFQGDVSSDAVRTPVCSLAPNTIGEQA